MAEKARKRRSRCATRVTTNGQFDLVYVEREGQKARSSQVDFCKRNIDLGAHRLLCAQNRWRISAVVRQCCTST